MLILMVNDAFFVHCTNFTVVSVRGALRLSRTTMAAKKNFLAHFINKTHIQEMGVVLLPTFFDA